VKVHRAASVIGRIPDKSTPAESVFVAYDIPEGCIAGYYPECNPLIPLWHHAEKAKVPAAKSIPVRVHREA